MKSHAMKPANVAPAVIDPSQLTHEDIDLTITALEIYATAIKDEIEEQAESLSAAAAATEEEGEQKIKANFDYEQRLADVQELLKKYREILKGLLTA